MQKGRKCRAHVRLKKTREARLQSQETQSQSQAAGRPHSGLGAAQHAGYMQLRTTSDLWKMTGNGLPRKCCWQRWALPGVSPGSTLLVKDPQEAKEMPASRESCQTHRGRPQELLVGIHRYLSEKGVGATHSRASRLALHARVNTDPMDPSYHESEHVQGGFLTAAHDLQSTEVSERCWGG